MDRSWTGSESDFASIRRETAEARRAIRALQSPPRDPERPMDPQASGKYPEWMLPSFRFGLPGWMKDRLIPRFKARKR